VLYDVFALTWASFLDIDTIYLMGYAASLFCIIPRLFGKTVIINVDGLEWKRRKFPRPIRHMLRLLEIISAKVVNCTVCDSKSLQSYYKRNYGIESTFIAYPTDIVQSSERKLIEKFGLKKGQYFMMVARVEPENNIDLTIEGFKKSGSNKRLIIIGPLTNTRYVKRLFEIKDDRVMFLGGIYDRKTLEALRVNCFAYIHGHEVGGTNPSLLDALGCGNAVIAFDVPFNREVARDAGVYFERDSNDLAEKIWNLEQHSDLLISMRKRALQIVKHDYTREKIINSYVSLFLNFKKRYEEVDKNS